MGIQERMSNLFFSGFVFISPSLILTFHGYLASFEKTGLVYCGAKQEEEGMKRTNLNFRKRKKFGGHFWIMFMRHKLLAV